MVNGYSYKPLTYYPLVFISTFTLWIGAALLSSKGDTGPLLMALLLAGLVAPFAVSLIMIATSGERSLAKDFIARLTDPNLIDLKTLALASLSMPVIMLVSVGLSLPVGGEISQLKLSDGFSFSAGAMPVILVLLAAAVFEELGWRGYAFDSLQSRYDFLTASLIFGVLWSLWHLPLLWVKDSYQFNILRENTWYAVNFFVSIVPMGVILSWVCVRSRKSIAAAAIFHFAINISQEMFEVTQLTKSIETAVLAVAAACLIALDRKTFFARVTAEEESK